MNKQKKSESESDFFRVRTVRAWAMRQKVTHALKKKAKEEGIDQLFLTEPLLFSKKLLKGRVLLFMRTSSVDT